MNDFLSPPEIADYADALRSLARAIVRDPAAADDAVQDTLAQALRTPPRRGPSVGAWFRTVLRNTVRRQARTNARRSARETKARSALQGDAPDVGQERMEVAQALIDAVRALPDVQRESIELRYFEDLTPTQIADRLELPLQTVKTRLKRALKRLRESLARDRGSEWRAMVSLAFGLRRETLPPPPLKLVAPAVAVIAAGVLVVTIGAMLREEPEAGLLQEERIAQLPASAPKLSGRKARTPMPAAKRAPKEATGFRMFGSAVLVHQDGSETPVQRGTLLLTLSHRHHASHQDGIRRLAIDEGGWNLTFPPETPERDEPRSFMPVAVLLDDQIALGIAQTRQPARVEDAGGPHVLRFRPIPKTVIHVVDALSGDELPGARLGFIDPAVDGSLIPAGGAESLSAAPIDAHTLIDGYLGRVQSDVQNLTLHGYIPARVHVPGRGWHRWNVRLGGHIYLPIPDTAVGTARFQLVGQPSLWFELRRGSEYGEVVDLATITSSALHDVGGLAAGRYYAEVFALPEGGVRQVHARTSFQIRERGQVVSRTLSARASLKWVQARGSLRIAREWATTRVRTPRVWRQHLRKEGLPPAVLSPWANYKELTLTVRAAGIPARVFWVRADGAATGQKKKLEPMAGEPSAWAFDIGRTLPGEFDFLVRCIGNDGDVAEASFRRRVTGENADQIDLTIPPPRRIRLRLESDDEPLGGRAPLRMLRWRNAWDEGYRTIYRSSQREPFDLVATADAVVIGLSATGVEVVPPVALDSLALDSGQVYTLKTESMSVMGLKFRGVNVGADFLAHWVDITHIAEDGVATPIELDTPLEPGCRAVELSPRPWADGEFALRLWTSGKHRVSVSRHPALRHVPDQEIDVRGPYYTRNMVEFQR